MQINKRLRHYWHHIYYSLASDTAVDFALNCREASEKIDLKERPKTLLDRIRFLLHLSLCQACSNYLGASRALGRALKNWVTREDKNNVEKVNKELLRKFTGK